MRKIILSHECPPIPIRTMDWCAYFEGDEEGGSRGWGRTAREAIADLIDNLDEGPAMSDETEYPADIYALARSIWAELLTVRHPASTVDALRDVDSIAEALMSERGKVESWEAGKE